MGRVRSSANLVEGHERVERVPAAWVEDVRRRVEEGRQFKQAVAEVLTAGACGTRTPLIPGRRCAGRRCGCSATGSTSARAS
jgi:hypothetical protein